MVRHNKGTSYVTSTTNAASSRRSAHSRSAKSENTGNIRNPQRGGRRKDTGKVVVTRKSDAVANAKKIFCDRRTKEVGYDGAYLGQLVWQAPFRTSS